MPRNRRDNNENIQLTSKDIEEEDYLDVDKPLPGQNYYCISFVSPEKVLEQKEFFMFYHYERAFYKKIYNMMNNYLTNLIDKSDDGKIDVSDIIKLKKNTLEAYKEEEVNFEQFKTKFEDFRFRDEEKIGEEFDKQNNFRTSVRGVKVRGVFNTKNEADIRASVLQRIDPLFDVFVGQLGYWCPWDPNPHKIDDIEYTNSELNKLVKEYKTNEAKKDQFYQEQKTQRQKDALTSEERIKHQKGLNEMRDYQQKQQLETSNNNTNNNNSSISNTANIINMIQPNNNNQDIPIITELNEHEQSITQSIDIGNQNSKEINFEQQNNILQSDDPWLQRKLEQKKY
jgi:hypothetical protein